ncbi:hypothetical protein [Lactococcus sp. bn62]|uniref:hypothetical protein n=1 Tax=Lactococcus sp. bn62 TaxID=3037457 RepID=UPI0024C47C5B|nr:hypothetical protein [Lactococcus sp. bn62]WKY24627.1 hypothetical protein P3G65_02115 [Lactococcus sp. bn62]
MMGIKVTAVALNNEDMRAEVSASLKLEIIHKLTSGFVDWNNCEHEEFNTGYMNCLIDTVHVLSEGENQDEEIHR